MTSRTRWFILSPFLLLLFATIFLSSCSYVNAFEIGRISPRGSWDFRIVDGRIDFIRMNYAWPHMAPGWNIADLSGGQDTDKNFLWSCDHFAGVQWVPPNGYRFVAVSFWTPIAVMTILTLLAVRLTRLRGLPSLLAILASDVPALTLWQRTLLAAVSIMLVCLCLSLSYWLRYIK